MFEISACTPMRGDCTCGYNIILDKEYTVREFIETVLKEKSDEWGYFGIYKYGSTNSYGDPNCQYSRGKLTTPPLPDEYLDEKIIQVTGDGGWTRMDYLFQIY